ncbi:MAG: cation:proton antiporter [Candidatus Aminicenantes bacterium]|nr:MAG: cation:proton antiporter [Candidatus Aminicenantes bacterium]
MDVKNILFLVSLIIFLGYLAEWLFKKINIPDTLLLIVVGFIIGPNVLNYIDPHALGTLAPLFTTFTLLFLMFDGALSIDLRSFAEGIGAGITIGFSIFFVSAVVIAGIFYFLLYDPLLSLMLGFSLGGVSSAFIIPLLKQIKVDKKLYSILTLESALTDVLSIVFAITMMELKILNVIEIKTIFSEIASLFFVAGMLGILAGFLWIFLENKQIIEEDRNYMMTIAYVVLLYFITEYLGGNGAIAAMCFGIVIANSKIMISMAQKIKRPKKKVKKETQEEKPGKIINVVSRRERMFYQEISFFLKTFFFVYIGLLLNIKNLKAVGIGSGIAVAILLLRYVSLLFTKNYKKPDRMLVNSLFARGIAPAAIMLMAMEKQLLMDQTIIDVVYFIITATIILSSLRVFFYKLKIKKPSSTE